MKTCLVIYNPYSGKYIKRNFRDAFLETLSKEGYEGEFVTTDYKGHAKELAKMTTADFVISIGGDGTFSEIIQGNEQRERQIVLSHIPLGTANDIGSMYGYGKDVIDNLNLILNGEIKDVDLCTINGTPFIYTTGFGKFIDVSYNTPRSLKSKYGYLAYIIKALEELRTDTPKYHIRCTVDGKLIETDCALFLATNSTKVAGTPGFYKNVLLDDGKFEVIIVDIADTKDLVSKFCSLLCKNGETDPRFKFFRTDNFQISFDKDNPSWCIDGDHLEEESNSYTLETKNKVKLLLPRKNTRKLFTK